MKDNHKADISHTDEFDRMYQEMVKQAEDKYKVKSEHLKTEEEMPLDKAGQITDFEYDGLAYTLPDGYIFKDENGNVINATKIVLEKKKKEYPKTYEECCRIIGFCSDTFKWDNPFRINRDTHPYIKNLDNLMEGFCKLLICRDAYLKLYSEENGLEKPWEPDWTNEHQVKYTIYTMGNDVIRHVGNYIHAILAFPTEEMRDAFYENFKELIESCKELL